MRALQARGNNEVIGLGASQIVLCDKRLAPPITPGQILSLTAVPLETRLMKLTLGNRLAFSSRRRKREGFCSIGWKYVEHLKA